MKATRGFTLIEILIALTVFAVLATITSGVLYNAFNTRVRVNEQADQLNALELAFSLIQKDTRQAVIRGVRGNQMRPYPPFIGHAKYTEMTVDGNLNPNASEQRSTLKRMAYLCKNNQLIRRTWAMLDVNNRKEFHDQVLLENLQQCNFNYLSDNLQVLQEWRPQAVTQNQRSTPLPKAIQLHIKLQKWGEASLYFVIPEAVYHGKK